MRDDILEQLRIDPGRRTLGQLLQDREAALHEIERLRNELERVMKNPAGPLPSKSAAGAPESAASSLPFRAGTMIRLSDVCDLLGISRSTVYKRVSEGTFPPPVHLGPGTVRWRIEVIEAWRDAQAARQPSRRSVSKDPGTRR
jgi:prophage regulatory protein